MAKRNSHAIASLPVQARIHPGQSPALHDHLLEAERKGVPRGTAMRLLAEEALTMRPFMVMLQSLVPQGFSGIPFHTQAPPLQEQIKSGATPIKGTVPVAPPFEEPAARTTSGSGVMATALVSRGR